MEKRNLSTARYYGDVWNNAGLGESAFMGYLFASIDWIARGSGGCLKFVHTSSNTNVLGQKKEKKKNSIARPLSRSHSRAKVRRLWLFEKLKRRSLSR